MTTGGLTAQGSGTDDDLVVAVVGLGRVGLITAVGMAELGWQVFGAESDCAKAQQIRQGIVPFYEEGVEEPLRAHLASARLNVENSVSAAIERADVVFVCVGTPEGHDGSADVSELGKVAAAIGASLDGYKLVVQKSTCPVKTSEMIERVVAEHSAANGGSGEGGFDVAVNPEFLREGRAMYDFLHPTRIVLGVDSDRAASLLRRVYGPLLDRMGGDADSAVVVTDRGTAEIVKHAANAFLATKISFANIVADLCEATGADIEDVTRALGMDPRIGPYLRAGIGYGGSCLPKDVRAIVSSSAAAGRDLELLAAVERVNQRQQHVLFDKITMHFGGQLAGKVIALWGLSFKPNTDDMREASSRVLMESLWEAGSTVRAFDPVAMDAARRHYRDRDDLVLCPTAENAVKGADALAIVTEWREFRSPDFEVVKSSLRTPVIFDGRNIYEPAQMQRHGFVYFGVGRGASVKRMA